MFVCVHTGKTVSSERGEQGLICVLKWQWYLSSWTLPCCFVRTGKIEARRVAAEMAAKVRLWYRGRVIWFNLACSLQDGGDDILGLQVLTRVGCSTGCLKSWFGKWSCSLHEPFSFDCLVLLSVMFFLMTKWHHFLQTLTLFSCYRWSICENLRKWQLLNF